MNRLLTAVAFAERAHRGQIRKYTGEPYIIHPIEVSQLVASVQPMPISEQMQEFDWRRQKVGTEGMIHPFCSGEDTVIAALLHDVVEDTMITLEQIRKAFGPAVAQLVHEVTDVSRKEHGNRKVRKAMDREHLAKASPEGKTIKLADLISNTQSITYHDPGFAQVYMREKRELLPLLAQGHPTLYRRAQGLVEAWERGITEVRV